MDYPFYIIICILFQYHFFVLPIVSSSVHFFYTASNTSKTKLFSKKVRGYTFFDVLNVSKFLFHTS